MPPKHRPADSDFSGMWKVSGLGMELAGSIIGPALLGWWIDGKLGTSPRWTTILIAVGFIGGGYNFGRRAIAMSRSAMEHDELGQSKQPYTDLGDAEDDGAPGPPGDDDNRSDPKWDD